MSGAEEEAAPAAAAETAGGSGGSSGSGPRRRFDDKGLVARTSLILWHTHQNDVNAVRKLLEEDGALVHARDYDSRTPLHVAALHGWHDVAECLIANGADINAQDRWQNTPLADAEGAKRHAMIELLKKHGGLTYVFRFHQSLYGVELVGEFPTYCSAAVLGVMFLNLYPGHLVPNIVTRSRSVVFGCVSVNFRKMLEELTMDDLDILVLYTWISVRNCHMYNRWVIVDERPDTVHFLRSYWIRWIRYGCVSEGKTGSHFEPKTIPPPLTNKADWEIYPLELDFTNAVIIGKGSFGEILKANWRGTPIAVKRILPSLSDDRLVIQDFKHEVNLLIKLRHPNIVQFLGAVTETKPLMLVTEFLRGGDLHQYLKEKRSLTPLTAVNFALDIARGMTYLHNEPNVVIHRDLKPRNILLVNSAANHLKVGDFGLSKIIKAQHANDVYKMTGETGSYRYMAPEVFKHRKYDKKVDIFSFAMILYEMLEGDQPFSNYEPYEAAKYVAEGHRPAFRSKGYSSELKELTELCWDGDINLRPSFLEILKRLEKIKENLSHDHHWHLFSQ